MRARARLDGSRARRALPPPPALRRPRAPRPPRPPALGRGPVFVDFLIADYNFPSFERLSYSRSIYDRKIKFVTFIRHVFKTYIHFQ